MGKHWSSLVADEAREGSHAHGRANLDRSRPMGPPAASDGAVTSPAGERFCVTTAINYANGPPHMGHAYEAITADVIARYHRAYGREVSLLCNPLACCPAAPFAYRSRRALLARFCS